MLLKKFLICYLCFISLQASSQKKEYQKSYYENGTTKEEGWTKNNKRDGYWKSYYSNGQLKSQGRFKNDQKSKYWYFYRKNGSKISEGHFKNGKKSKWWLFYDGMGHIKHKCQLIDNHKNGYCLIYEMEKLIKASKYKEGKKIKEWTDFSSFKKENSLSDLRK